MDEEVRYQFTGDLSNLRDSVQNAIGLLDRYAQQFRRTDRVTTQLSNQRSTRRSFQDLRNSVNNLGRSFRDNTKHLKSFAVSVDSLSGKTRLLGRALGAVTAIKVGDWLAKSVKESIAYIENLNLFTVAMGESVEEGLKFVDTMSEIYGMDPSNLYRYTGYFYELTDAIGMADDASAVLSLSLTKASNDIASLFNVPIDQVVNNLASGMQGMSRAVRKYGMDIRATTLQQTAYTYGLTEEVSKMSEADRMALRYLTMMNQVRDATQQVVDPTQQASGVMGDFARNIETPANQLRIFKEQITQLGRAIGNFFIPILRAVLPVLNGIIMALRTILTFVSALTGLDFNFGGISTGADDSVQAYGDAIASAGEEAEEAGKKIKKLQNTVLGFDELNLLNAPQESDTSKDSSSTEDSSLLDTALNPVLAEAIQNFKLDLEDIQMKANKVRDAILEFLGFKYEDNGTLKWYAEQFETNLINKFPQWELTIKALFDNWNGIMLGFKNVFESLGTVIDAVKTKMQDFLASLHLDEAFSSAIKALPEHLNKLSDWIEAHASQIADFIIGLGQLYLGFKLFQNVYKFLAPLVAIGIKIAPVVVNLIDLVAPLLAVGAAVALLYQNSEAFATSFKNLFRTIVDSFSPIAESVETLVQRIWTSLQTLWKENLQPMVQSIGDMLAPIIDTLSVFWQALSEIFQSIMDMLGNIWENTIHPIIAAIADAISNLASIIKDLWETYIGPVLDHIFESMPEIWDSIQPVIEKIIDIIGGLIELILALWNKVLAPVLNWWVKTFGPEAKRVALLIWDVFKQTFEDIMEYIADLLSAWHGLIEFIVGVFTGDWDRALKGLAEIASSIVNMMIDIVETAINAIISVINALISNLYSKVQDFVNSILDKINAVADFVGYSINITWSGAPPEIGYVNLPRVAMASGGVVTSPTQALIGEGRYDEAVIPLGNSPQMNDFANSIAGKINTDEQISLLREQNSLLRQILERTGNGISLNDLSRAITREQRLDARARGSI